MSLSWTKLFMNWESISTSVLISGIVSSVIALYANERIKRTEFNFNFKKYILDKRIATYEKIEELLNSFFEAPTNEKYMDWFVQFGETAKDSVFDYQQKITKILERNQWLSQPIIATLSDISDVLQVTIKEMDSGNELEKRIANSEKIVYRFFMLQADLQKYYFADISKMNKVEAFLKAKGDDMHSIVITVKKVIASKLEKKK